MSDAETASISLLNADGSLRPLRDIEQDVIEFALEYNGFNSVKTARELRIGRSTLYRRTDRYEDRNRDKKPKTPG